MEIDPRTYPSRAFIRFTAQNQLRADLTGQSFIANVHRGHEESYVKHITPSNASAAMSDASEDAVLDEALFEEIAKTAFNAVRHPELYQSCGTAKAAKAVEDKVTAELIEAYLQIKLKQRCPIVARLNALL